MRNPLFILTDDNYRPRGAVANERRHEDMTSTRESYQHGLSLGYDFADEDRRDGAAFATNAEGLREEAEEARDTSESWRAFKLGIVRGYRESVRTLRAGRWGT